MEQKERQDSDLIESGTFILLRRSRIKFKHLLGCARLDWKYFPGEFAWPSIKPLFWFHKNKDIYDIVVDSKSGKVVGYSLLLPIYEDSYKKFLTGDFVDMKLNGSDISTCRQGEEIYLYVSSLIIDKRVSHGKFHISKFLVEGMKERIKRYMENGAVIKGMLADTVSKEGSQNSHSLGMNPYIKTKHGSTIYIGEFHPEKFIPEKFAHKTDGQ